MTTPESYTGIRVRQADAERFRQLGRELAADVGRDLTQSEILAAITAYSSAHRADVAAALAEAPPDPGGSPALSNRAVYATAGK